ncbi:uncharacterized protein LOC130552199 [Triplophysa rosa]|uniref:uncharacterized protein LOC130552199 n=1 Tax=Triplophysa rosa TaxID=992332 RepID=UPI0025461D3E|nr:uncharacterized protein LOC130552199 [Triplophysa rosa]
MNCKVWQKELNKTMKIITLTISLIVICLSQVQAATVNTTTPNPIIQTLNHTSLPLTFQLSTEASNNSIPELQGKQRRNIKEDYSMNEGETKLDALWETAQSNQWYEWATYTATELKKKDCLFCTKTQMSQVIVVPNPFDYEHCAKFNRDFCHLRKDVRYFCPAECLAFLSNPGHMLLFKNIPLLRAKCKSVEITEGTKRQHDQVEIPPWYTIDYSKEYECFFKSTGVRDVGQFKGKCSVIWNLDTKPFRNVDDSMDFPPSRASGIRRGEKISPAETCENQTISLPVTDLYEDQTKAIADYFWICGKRKLLSSLPPGWRGKCTRVRLIQEIKIIEWDSESTRENNNTINHRAKRSYIPDPKVYIDSIGQPRGIPDQFKLRDEVKSGFESIFIWISQNKNTEWINYIYYNQQRFINYTNEALISLGEQLDATSKMTWQNRLALNWMLADKGGVCVLFGNQCCTYIPNNTAPEGTFTKAMTKLKELQIELATNAGNEEKLWDWFNLKLGSWRVWLAKLGILLGVTIGMGGLLFCCALPLLKSLIIKATVKQMEMLRYYDDEKRNLTHQECHQDMLYKTVLKLQRADEITNTSNEYLE